jgi:hypothetical protein
MLRTHRLALVACVAFVGAACGPASSDGPAARTSAVGPWITGTQVGVGVSRWDADNPLGANVFIGYGGYGISLAETQAWVAELYAARLHTLGVRTLFAVQGPADVGYAALEIGNSRIGAYLQQNLAPDAGFVLVAAHSSGAFVAGEFLQQLANGADPTGAIASRLVYFNLDGGQKYVTTAALQRLRRVYHASAWLPATGQTAWNHGTMQSLGNTWASKGGFLRYDASTSGCTQGACLHISLINTRPHSSSSGSGIDYTDFAGRPVNTWYLDEVRTSAGIGQCTTPYLTEGAIEEKYAQLGGCKSPLGEPRTNTTPTVDGVGRFNLFEHGAVYVSPNTGAYAVVNPVYSAWAATGHEVGPLGYPVSDSASSNGTSEGTFEHGILTVFPDGGMRLSLAGEDAGTPPPEAPDAGMVPARDGGTATDAGTVPAPPLAAGCSSVHLELGPAVGLLLLGVRRRRR